jgi:hypothetical protein
MNSWKNSEFIKTNINLLQYQQGRTQNQTRKSKINQNPDENQQDKTPKMLEDSNVDCSTTRKPFSFASI